MPLRAREVNLGEKSPAVGSAATKTNGAEEGTRTPTPLRVHGPEPCASANSATSAKSVRGNSQLPFGKGLQVIFYRGRAGCQTIQSRVRRPAGLPGDEIQRWTTPTSCPRK